GKPGDSLGSCRQPSSWQLPWRARRSLARTVEVASVAADTSGEAGSLPTVVPEGSWRPPLPTQAVRRPGPRGTPSITALRRGIGATVGGIGATVAGGGPDTSPTTGDSSRPSRGASSAAAWASGTTRTRNTPASRIPTR